MKYFEKIADVAIGKGDIIAGGLFVGTESDHKKKSEELKAIMRKSKTLREIREAYQKKYPDDYTTLAFRKMKKPKFWSNSKDKKFYEDRVKSPRLFFRVAKAGSPEQQFFYRGVVRAKYDNELDKGEPVYL